MRGRHCLSNPDSRENHCHFLFVPASLTVRILPSGDHPNGDADRNLIYRRCSIAPKGRATIGPTAPRARSHSWLNARSPERQT